MRADSSSRWHNSARRDGRAAAQLAQVIEQLFSRERVVERDSAWQVPQPTAYRHAVAYRVESEHASPSGGRMKKPEQQANRRALSGAVRPQEPEYFALANGDVERFERPDWRRRRRPKPRQQRPDQPRRLSVIFGETDGLDRVHSPSFY